MELTSRGTFHFFQSPTHTKPKTIVEAGRPTIKQAAKPSLKRRDRKKSLSQQWASNSELEEAKDENAPPETEPMMMEDGVNSSHNESPRNGASSSHSKNSSSSAGGHNPTAKAQAKSLFAADPNAGDAIPLENPVVDKNYILSLLQPQLNGKRPPRVPHPSEKKPLFKKCATHIGIAYYVQFSKKKSKEPAPVATHFVRGSEITALQPMRDVPAFLPVEGLIPDDPRLMLQQIAKMMAGESNGAAI